MTDDKGAGEGPYTDGWGRGAYVVGPGLKDKQQRTWIDVDLASLLNLAYAEGRKSAEKEFQELLELANEAGYFNQDMMIWRMKYADWKKARGIE